MTFAAFNGDRCVAAEFLRIKKEFDIRTVVETGTFQGDTTQFFAENFYKTVSIEVDPGQFAFTQMKLSGLRCRADLYCGDSADYLNILIPQRGIGDDTIFFLDAHWGSHCPLLDELRAIGKYRIRPVIVIHDFKEPSGRLGYDTYNGQSIDLAWVRPSLVDIYGEDGYRHWFNNPDTAEGARRGVLYVVPKISNPKLKCWT